MPIRPQSIGTVRQTFAVIEAVFFDGEQTLGDFQKLMRRALERTLTELCRHRSCEATDQLYIEDMVADRAAVAAELEPAGASLEGTRHAAFVRTLWSIGLPDLDLNLDLDLTDHLNEHYRRWRFRALLPGGHPECSPVAPHGHVSDP